MVGAIDFPAQYRHYSDTKAPAKDSTLLRAYLRRWLGVADQKPVVEVMPGNLRRDVSELREDVDFLAQQVERLRGKVTGGVRRKEPEPETSAPPPAPAADPQLDLTTHRDGWLTLAEARRNGLLSR